MNFGTSNPYTVAASSASERGRFIQSTYLHVAGACLALIVIDAIILSTPLARTMALTMMGSSFGWLIVLGLFMVVTTIANKWAMSDTSRQQQYLGLGLFTLAEAIILVPLLYFAMLKAGDARLIIKAGLVTGGMTLGLTAIAFTTKADFSFLGGFIKVALFVAFGIIIAGLIFGFSLGLWFIGAMILLMSICILYTTSNIIHHYNTSQHVAAALALFSSIATLFWYVLQFFMSFDE